MAQARRGAAEHPPEGHTEPSPPALAAGDGAGRLLWAAPGRGRQQQLLILPLFMQRRDGGGLLPGQSPGDEFTAREKY